MTKHLFLVRHALAETSSPMQKDIERLLLPGGIAEATKMGERLAQLQVDISFLITSPAARCASTAELIAERFNYDTEAIRQEPDLYEASVRSLLSVINQLEESHKSVMLVSHNPSISYLAEFLTRAEIGSLPTCGVVHIQFDGLTWAEITGQTGNLIWFEYPEKNNEIEA